MKKWLIVSMLLALVGLMAPGCAPGRTLEATLTPPAATQPPALPTETAEPSPTPQPGKVLLAGPPGGDLTSSEELISGLSVEAGLLLERIPDLQPAMLSPEVKVVVLLAPAANLAELLAAAPQAQFIVVSAVDQPPAGNLSVIRLRQENQVFLAGFISVLLSSDWRSAGLLPADGPAGAALQDAFVNGGRYFCGVCAPGWPLRAYYPQVAALPAASDGPTWLAAAAGLFDSMAVEAYYVAPEAMQDDVTAYLQGRQQFGKTVLLVGGQAPPDTLRSQWAATVRFDVEEALRQVWADALNGTGGGVVEAPLVLADVDLQNLGQGRLRLVEQLMEEMKAGRVYPLTLPQQ